MGYECVLFAFDETRFTTTVLPEYQKLRQTYLANTWMQERILDFLEDNEVWDPINYPVGVADQDVDVRQWLYLVTDIDEPIPVNRVPIYPEYAYNDCLFDPDAGPDCVMRVGPLCLHDLWQNELVRCCETPAIHVAKSAYFDNWASFAEALFKIPRRHRLTELFDFLGLRAFEDSCGDCRDIAGVQGWLTAEETRELVKVMEAFELPRFADYAAAKAARDEFWARSEYNHDGFMRLTLGIIRSAATLASEKNLGLLHGVDMGPWV